MTLDHFSGRLFAALEQRNRFDGVLRRIMDPVPAWTIDQSDSGQYYVKVQTGDEYHTSDGLGEGIISLFFVVDALYDSEPGDVIVIDEPELSLHPAFQRRLASVLADFSRDRQVVYATHSPYFVDFGHVVNGAEVARIHKTGTETVVSQLGRETATRLGGFLANLNNPHVLGLDAREALFIEDGVVLVEGQEDVVFYSRLMSDVAPSLSHRFFGWGVGGAGNVEIIASLLQDLGFQRVAGIVDADQAGLVERLSNHFPDFHFASIPADDVRSKGARLAKPSVHGLLDGEGHIRPEFEDETRKLFRTLNEYIGPPE